MKLLLALVLLTTEFISIKAQTQPRKLLSMNVHVTVNSGALTAVEVPADATVLDLLRAKGFNGDYNVTCNGFEIEQSASLADAGICAGQDVHLNLQEKVYDLSDMRDTHLNKEDVIRISKVKVNGSDQYNGVYNVVDSDVPFPGSQQITLTDDAKTTTIMINMYEAYNFWYFFHHRSDKETIETEHVKGTFVIVSRA